MTLSAASSTQTQYESASGIILQIIAFGSKWKRFLFVWKHSSAIL